MILSYHGKYPRIEKDVFIAPTAVVIGEVTIAPGSSIWYGAVLRGDEGKIVVGRNCNVQDNAVLHTTPHCPTVLGDDVTVGHGALLEGCEVGDGAVIGMGAVLLEQSKIGAQSMIGAGSVVGRAAVIPPGTLAAGSPAVIKKELGGAALESIKRGAPTYARLARSYLDQGMDSPADETDPQGPLLAGS